MSVKLGDHTILAENEVDDLNNRDDYGQPAKAYVYTEVHWCQFTPTRASEANDRQAPAVSGATLLAPPDAAGVIVPSTTVLYPFSDGVDPDGRRLGRRWAIAGEIGQWDEALELQLRRLT